MDGGGGGGERGGKVLCVWAVHRLRVRLRVSLKLRHDQNEQRRSERELKKVEK